MPSHEEGLGLLHGPGGYADEVSSQEAGLGSIGKNFLMQSNGTVDLREPSLMETGPDLESEDERLDQRIIQSQ